MAGLRFPPFPCTGVAAVQGNGERPPIVAASLCREATLPRLSSRHTITYAAGMTARKTQNDGLPTVSAVLAEGVLVELVYKPEQKQTAFVVWEDGKRRETQSMVDAGQTLVPYPADSPLIQHNVVLFPSKPEDYGSYDKLVDKIRSYVRRYVDLSEQFEIVAAHYVLLTWLYDCFNELPYLRVRGDYGTGKTRFLQIVGSICYRPTFVSGASTVSPIFHLLDTFRGTLILDEADFRCSDEKAELVKILNNGNTRGMPLLRARMSRHGEFEPRVFDVFGPKIVAMRTRYDDEALESRFITEDVGMEGQQFHAPLNLPSTYAAEALDLRNRLLMYRLQNWRQFELGDKLRIRGLQPRRNQVLVPLVVVGQSETHQVTITSYMERRV